MLGKFDLMSDENKRLMFQTHCEKCNETDLNYRIAMFYNYMKCLAVMELDKQNINKEVK